MDDVVLGLGDSITEGPGDSALGVLPRPWAWWLALALDAPFHGVSRPGATTPEVLRLLVPRVTGRRYALACVHLGTNDVRHEDWDPAVFETSLYGVLSSLDAVQTAVATLPRDLGRPRAGVKVAEAGAIVRTVAADVGATVVDLDDLRGWRDVMPDGVHPTALGQLAIADRAAAALGIVPRPSGLAEAHGSRRALARYALTRHLPMAARDVRRRIREGVRR